MAQQKFSERFRQVAKAADNGEIVIPILRNYLWTPTFKSFPMTMPDFSKRGLDGKFHPSEHPTWGERQLYYYLLASAGEAPWEPEPFDPASIMAVTQGHFWHEFTGVCLVDAGYLTEVEVQVYDPVLGAGGHMDGIGGVGGVREVFEFKTMGSRRASNIEDGRPDDPLVLASFKKYMPTYYWQGQEYLRISGFQRWRCLILTLEYPYLMREIVMEHDPMAAHEIRSKYERVRAAFEARQPPPFCCSLGTKQALACPARGTCEMAVLGR